MPSSQVAATERRNERTVTPHEPPKLKTTLKTPPKQATNPLQFVKVGPCSLYRSAQEQLQKVQETKKIKQEVRDDPEDWQSNLDNWKSSRRKRQEHIIERVVEVKKLELEEHDRQRRRSKTFSEMMEERGNRGRKLSMSLAMYHEEDANDLSDLGIGTSSGKSSVSGDTHDDTQSVTSDRDSEIEKNHSDAENASENNNVSESKTDIASSPVSPPSPPTTTPPSQQLRSPRTETESLSAPKKSSPFTSYEKDFRNECNDSREYDSANTATASSPEPEEYTYEGAIRGYVSRVTQNIPRRGLVNLETPASRDVGLPYKSEEKSSPVRETRPSVKVDVLKTREIFERASRNSHEARANTLNNNCVPDNRASNVTVPKPVETRLACLERQNLVREDTESNVETRGATGRSSIEASSMRERLNQLEIETSQDKTPRTRETSSTDMVNACARPRIPEVRAVSAIMKRNTIQDVPSSTEPMDDEDETCRVSEAIVKKYASLETSEESTSSPLNDACPRGVNASSLRANFHRSLDSLESDAASPVRENFERVRSLEEIDYNAGYTISSSSADVLNDLTDREDSGIHTADVSCSVSQADENADDEVNQHERNAQENGENVNEDEIVSRDRIIARNDNENANSNEIPVTKERERDATAVTIEDTAETATPATTVLANSRIADALTRPLASTARIASFDACDDERKTRPRPIVYQSPRLPGRKTRAEIDALSNETGTRHDSPKVPASKPRTEWDADNPSVSVATIGATKKSNSPEASKRTTISKIPTPLARKNLNARTITKIPQGNKIVQFKTNTRIPSTQFSTASKTCEDTSNVPQERQSNERRRTVVEICEKIVLTDSDLVNSPPVTPFVNVSTTRREFNPVNSNDNYNNNNNEESSSVADVLSDKMIEPENVLPSSPQLLADQQDPNTTSDDPMKKQRRTLEIHPEVTDGATQAVAVAAPRSCSSTSHKLDSEDSEIIVSRISSPLNREAVIGISYDPLIMTKQIPQLNLTSDEELVTGLTFPLGPPTSVEPPKEKPPPPPTDVSDDDEEVDNETNVPIEPLKRLNSTRRIKKELRTRRSDFLGIEGTNDDYFERELTLTRPPDMAALLAEERRVEQMNRRSYDTDSNYERDSSHERDSGVELGHAEDWRKQPVSPDMSEHSRQSSEPFGASVTSSEEDEITKKEREIIEVLEKEEQWRYGNNREQNSDIGEKLAHKLRELEEEKMQLERERAKEAELRRRQEEIVRKKEEEAMREQMEQREAAAKRALDVAKRLEEQKIRDEECTRRKAEEMRLQEEMEAENERRIAAETARRQDDNRRARTQDIGQNNNREKMILATRNDDDFASGEVLRVERELLQLEQEELKRRRTNVAYRQQRQLQLAEQLQEQWQSLQDVANVANITKNNSSPRCNYQTSVNNVTPVNYRSSMPNLWLQENQRRRPPPPPVPPSKPSRLVEQMHRDVTIRNSRIPSADSIPQQIEGERLLRSGSTSTLTSNAGQQMTKQTLHALSAVPRTRIVKGDEWVQRRKSDVPRGTHEYNYQHWLIQEAEQRRISEKNQRAVVTRKPQQQHAIGTSVPYNGAPPSSRSEGKPLPDSIIQTLTQRVQNRAQERPPPPPPPPHRRRQEQNSSHEHPSPMQHPTSQHAAMLQHQKVHQYANNADSQEKMLSVSGKKKCSHCGDELGRGAAMIIESLRLFYHMECFKCCVCHVRLGDGLMGTDVRVRNHKLHCHNCYSSDDGVKFSCV